MKTKIADFLENKKAFTVNDLCKHCEVVEEEKKKFMSTLSKSLKLRGFKPVKQFGLNLGGDNEKRESLWAKGEVSKEEIDGFISRKRDESHSLKK